MTVTTGDPSWAGGLAGVALDLPVYHVTEEAVKAEIAPSDYDADGNGDGRRCDRRGGRSAVCARGEG